MDEFKDVVLTRVYTAPVEKVWDAWTVSERVRQWWGPSCFTSPSAVMDVREGGTSVVCMRAPAEHGGRDLYNSWIYTRIVPRESIEFIQNMCDAEGRKLNPATLGLPAEFPRDQRNLVVLRDLGGGRTEMTVTQFGWQVCPFLDIALIGLQQCLDKLAASLEARAATA